MLALDVVVEESFDESKQEFVVKTFRLELEHSLVSLSKWESKYKKPFLGKDAKTDEEVRGYVETMIISPEYPPNIVMLLSDKNMAEINDYVEDKMTATWFADKPAGSNQQIITNELIYYWLTCYRIPWEQVENWHLNRLFTLIKVFIANNEKPKKMSPGEAAAKRHQLNEQRKAKYGTNG